MVNILNYGREVYVDIGNNREYYKKKGVKLMNSNKAIVIANNTVEGISVIDIHICDESGRTLIRPPKGVIDSINALPMLDKTKIKSAILRQYGVSPDQIMFSE